MQVWCKPYSPQPPQQIACTCLCYTSKWRCTTVRQQFGFWWNGWLLAQTQTGFYSTAIINSKKVWYQESHWLAKFQSCVVRYSLANQISLRPALIYHPLTEPEHVIVTAFTTLNVNCFCSCILPDHYLYPLHIYIYIIVWPHLIHNVPVSRNPHPWSRLQPTPKVHSCTAHKWWQ